MDTLDHNSAASPISDFGSLEAAEGARRTTRDEEDGRAAQGGNTPRQVIRGESPTECGNPRAAIVDWLNFTFPFELDIDSFVDIDTQFRQAFGFAVGRPRKSGYLNYEKCWDLGEGLSSLFAAGGDSVGGTAIVSLSGNGCTAVKDWHAVYEMVKGLRGRVTRIDLAHDDFAGVMDIRKALEFKETGGYTTRGRPPNVRYINDFDSGAGKTVYVGSRDNGKLLRVYEKGKQFGLPDHPWVRWELELHNTDRVIDLETIISPGTYLAGSYPCMSWVSETQDRIVTSRTILRTNFAHLAECCKNSYGQLIWTMRELGYTAEAIVEELSRKGIPSRLNIPLPGGGGL